MKVSDAKLKGLMDGKLFYVSQLQEKKDGMRNDIVRLSTVSFFAHFYVLNLWRYDMELSDGCLELIQKLSLKIDDIEKVLQLLLANSMLDNIDETVNHLQTGTMIQHESKVFFWESERSINIEVSEMILSYGLEPKGFKSINGIEVLMIEVPEKASITIRGLKQICSIIKSVYKEIEPLFIYKTLGSMQKKSILLEDISYGVEKKELRLKHEEKKNVNKQSTIEKIRSIY